MIYRLAEWVQALDLESIPGAVRTRAKHLLLDGVGAALIGAQLPWSRIATKAVADIEGAGGTAVIGTGLTTSGPAAVLLNSTSSRVSSSTTSIRSRRCTAPHW